MRDVCILLALSDVRQNDDAIEYSFRMAQEEGATLVVLYVVEEEALRYVSSWLIYIGFLGDKPSDDFKEVATQELWRRGADALEEIADSARDRGIQCETVLVEGSFCGYVS